MFFVILLVGVLLLPTTHAKVAKDFTRWYPAFGHYEEHAWRPCVDGAKDLTSLFSCGDTTNCILGALTEEIKAMQSSIGIFLGFTPTLISILGPSAMEVATLSLKRPLLSTLCAWGSPGFSVERPFKTLGLSFDQTPNTSKIEHEFFKHLQPASEARFKGQITYFILFIQYFLAAAAVGNTIYNSYEVSIKVVITFSCHKSNILPLSWYSFSVGINFLGIILMQLHRRQRAAQESGPTPTSQPKLSIQGQALNTLKSWAADELQLGCQRMQPYEARTRSWNIWCVVIQWIMNIAVIAQFAMGTVVMSSIYFVRLEDALVIMSRYLLSAFVVRCIVGFEIEGMSYATM